MKFITSAKAPKVVGPYSMGVIAGNLVFCSGQVGKDPKTNTFREGIEKQTLQTLKNLEGVLSGAKLGKKDIVKTTVYLKNVTDFPKMNAVYEKFFDGHKPARATVEVARLPQDALVEIEAIAVLKTSQVKQRETVRNKINNVSR
ncbi:hypothetical protein A3C28_02580 [Candidatus Roizmanbacteria bacterium RIFCSPHIGHO2_02_FULL_39_9]|uniref:Reactive intermediate/imine deaminase n=1 Tax=Candidatus Roizmanbacteria bacterium RIFCSPHIGHO2_02_FULL_39_9 TaxID=1802040 RepID=A0A1F7H945_9BACT|nr:MAG: hypothetical protein A3C28_02580 [Candidatus Roizmanbacteria bacterium RIFCSPHIGHO2_02_FULL_39_9]